MRRSIVLTALVMVAVVGQVVVPQPAAALVLPAGFQLVNYPTGQADYNLTNYAWLEDGGLLTAGKDGTVAYVPAGGSPKVLTKVPNVRAHGDHGMLGFALANDYATTGRVYLSYDKGDPDSTGVGMVEEWKASPASSPSTFTRTRAVLDGNAMSPKLAQATRNHGLDSVIVAPDDTLFVSVGDDAGNNGDPKTFRSQDLDQPYGKILHLTPEGKGVSTNPFYSATAAGSWRSMIFAYGMRNPFRISLDPRSGVLHVGDVGWRDTEEINTVVPGANGGWPCYEGNDKTTFSTDATCKALYAAGSAHRPIWTYSRSESGASVVGGIHYTGTSYPTKYRNAYFYGDYSAEQLWTLETDLTGKLVREPEANGFGTAAGGPVAFQPGPNGDVTYADILSGKVRRLVFRGGNRPPVAQLTATTQNAGTRTVAFSGSNSYDMDLDKLTYTWDFGDGSTAKGENVVHTYASGDRVEVSLTVHDPVGNADTATATVYPANHTPEITLTTPGSRTFAVGEKVRLSARASDEEDGPLSIRWDTALLHCPGSCHRHPDRSVTGATYAESFTDHGADTFMLITAYAVDAKGAVAVASYEARPALRTLAVNSPVAVSINGVTAASADVVAGSEVQVDAPAESAYWQFTGWSDGGAPKHSFTMPNADLTLSARYRTAVDAKYEALGGAASFLGAATSNEYDVAGGRARNYAKGRIYWSAQTGAHEVHGKILTKYRAEGGPSKMGFPTGDEIAVTGGRASYFTTSRIYHSAASGTHFSRGRLLDKYLLAGGPDAYGLPTTDDTSVRGGYYAHFTGGRSIYWSRPTGAHLVYGSIRKKYASMGYQKSCLKFPTSDEFAITDGRRNTFTGGDITYRKSTGRTTARC